MKKSINLIATPLSHFGRKVRILLDLYQLPYQFTDLVSIASLKTPSAIGNNPLMKVPILQIEDDWLIESDHIASYLVTQFDPVDKFAVHTKAVFDLNARAIMNGVMNEEVKIIMAGRHNVPTKNFTYFTRAEDAVTHGLTWLNAHHHQFDSKTPKYREFHLVCCWEHLVYYDFIPGISSKFPHLYELVSQVSVSTPVIQQSAPFKLVPK